MLDHLINFDPEVLPTAEAPLSVDKVTPAQALDAKINTTDWLKSHGIPDTDTVVSELEKTQAREAFTALTTAAPITTQHEMVTRLETPAAVRHLTGMLTAYDWEFVHQAKELRGYAVAKILEDCEHPNANIRLKALGLLGKVTEVGLFTEKIEVKKTDLTEQEIDAKLKEKLAKFMNVSDADVIDVPDVEIPTQTDTPAPAHPDETDVSTGNPVAALARRTSNPDETDVDPENPDA